MDHSKLAALARLLVDRSHRFLITVLNRRAATVIKTVRYLH
jgi:hypothetical protein